ncbi:MAG: malate dehydrogenase [Deltaproteobacteria bacterium]|nr:malate dehydrogenase [Deltaproteobacteria bacterium]
MGKKVTIIGAGNVGATAAMRIVERELADVILIDVVEGIAAGKALDLLEAAPFGKYDSSIRGFTNDFSGAKDSDIVIITAGLPRKSGMSRDDLLSINMGIMRSAVNEIKSLAPDSILIIVSNPLDAMCHVAYDTSGFPKERVIGMSGVLDSTRFRAFIAMELDVSVENIQAFVLGGHGDSMVPLPRYSVVAGIPITELMSKDRIDAIVERTRKGGAEIVGLLKTGSAFYAPAYAVVKMVEAILKDKKKILACSVFLEGEYGINNLFIGVPVKLGEKGVEEIIQLKLTDEEQIALNDSAAAVQALVDDIKRLG